MSTDPILASALLRADDAELHLRLHNARGRRRLATRRHGPDSRQHQLVIESIGQIVAQFQDRHLPIPDYDPAGITDLYPKDRP